MSYQPIFTAVMELINTITRFLQTIGIEVFFEEIEELTFLPGILIRKGTLIIDESKLLYPGDILHEAGHLAVMPERIRESMDGDLGTDSIQQGGELAAIAWSYAACKYLNIDPALVFHENGYKGGGQNLIENFEQGSEMGVHLLVWQEMTGYKDADSSVICFPEMKNWLCTVDKYV